MNNKIILGFVTAVTCFLYACSKGNETVTQLIPPQNLRIFGYKPGTYWIFRDSLTGYDDSISVKEYRLQMGHNNPNEIQFLGIYATRYRLQNLTDTAVVAITVNSDNSVSFWGDNFFYYPFKNSTDEVTYYSHVQILHPDIIINGRKYYNVLEALSVTSTRANDTLQRRSRMFVDTTVGCLSLDVSDNGISKDKQHFAYRLERYHIVR